MFVYFALRGPAPGSLFLSADGNPLNRDRFLNELWEVLVANGRNSGGYSGQFRVCAATTAARRGLEDSTIQMLGRWLSDANKRYVRLDAKTLAGYSRAQV